MSLDVIEFQSFYTSTLGRLTEESITMALSTFWTDLPQERLMGIGYPLPYLGHFCSHTERTFAFMSAGQGAMNWPSTQTSAVALVFAEELPLADSCIDRILMVHSLEYAENPSETLKEMWRILAPNGELIIIVPNRRGLWARCEHTPFGSGRPYSRYQLISVLHEINFTIGTVMEALHFPPTSKRWWLRTIPFIEKLGWRFLPIFGGVLIIKAHKRLYQGFPVVQRLPRRVFVPVVAFQEGIQGLRYGDNTLGNNHRILTFREKKDCLLAKQIPKPPRHTEAHTLTQMIECN